MNRKIEYTICSTIQSSIPSKRNEQKKEEVTTGLYDIENVEITSELKEEYTVLASNSN